jgi:hypothetical protein
MPPAKIITRPVLDAWMPKDGWLFLASCRHRTRSVDRDIDAADPGAFHPDVARQIPAGVDDGDVHRLANFARFGFYSGDHPLCVIESNHDIVLQS